MPTIGELTSRVTTALQAVIQTKGLLKEQTKQLKFEKRDLQVLERELTRLRSGPGKSLRKPSTNVLDNNSIAKNADPVARVEAGIRTLTAVVSQSETQIKDIERQLKDTLVPRSEAAQKALKTANAGSGGRRSRTRRRKSSGRFTRRV